MWGFFFGIRSRISSVDQAAERPNHYTPATIILIPQVAFFSAGSCPRLAQRSIPRTGQVLQLKKLAVTALRRIFRIANTAVMLA
jgi:hypothetical protein